MDLDPPLRHDDEQDSFWGDAYFVYGGPFRLFWLAGALSTATGMAVAARESLSVEGVLLALVGVLVLAANRRCPAGRDHVWWHAPRDSMTARRREAAVQAASQGGNAEPG